MSSDSPSTPSRSRASTITAPIVPVPEARQLILSPEDPGKKKKGDIFENIDESNDALDAELGNSVSEHQKPEPLDQLPIEIQSITERLGECITSMYTDTDLPSQISQVSVEQVTCGTTLH